MSLVKPKAMHFYMTVAEKQLLETESRKQNKSQAEVLRELIKNLEKK
jgi:hypothetical protein